MIKLQLIGNKIDIEDLNDSSSSDEWQILKENEAYFMCTDKLTGINNSHDSFLKASEYLNLLNGAANILYKNHINVLPGTFYTVDATGKTKAQLSGKAFSRTRARGTLTTVQKNETALSSKKHLWLVKAKQHKAVYDVLCFFADVSWWNLYKIYEIIRDDVSGQKGLNDLASHARVSLFKHTANSRHSIGEQARHAQVDSNPPVKPMRLDEAYILLREIFEKWVSAK